ncbi:MAG: ABC transporter ATP-binding protein [Pseudomonadota bacterium]
MIHQAAEPDPVLLGVKNLTKRYPNGVLANDAVSVSFVRGKVHAVVGENGAGKSTLMKMLYGLEQPDAGSMVLAGCPCHFRSPADAIARGIGLVPQHPQLVDSLSVAQNMVLGNEPQRGFWLDQRQAVRQTLELAQRYSLPVPAAAKAGSLSVGLRQRVEILKALRRGARLLLLDEPTGLLTVQEAEALFASLRLLVASGMTAVLITHKLSEVRDSSDHFTVLRAGRVVGEGVSAEVTQAQLAEMIVGRHVAEMAVQRQDQRQSPALVRGRNITVLMRAGRPLLDGVSIDVAAGEIVGVAGVEGNGQDKLADLLNASLRPGSGSLEFDGKPLAMGKARQTRQLGIGSIPEDRLHGGVAPGLSIALNLAALDYFKPPASRHGRLDLAWIRSRARKLIQSMGVLASNENTAVGGLSGGNMQKVLIARELSADPRFLIASQPTRGVDIGAAHFLRQKLVELRDGGAAILLVSADLNEVLELADRVVVMFEGRIVAHIAADQASQRVIGLYMTGMCRDEGASAALDAAFTDTTEAENLA